MLYCVLLLLLIGYVTEIDGGFIFFPGPSIGPHPPDRIKLKSIHHTNLHNHRSTSHREGRFINTKLHVPQQSSHVNEVSSYTSVKSDADQENLDSVLIHGQFRPLQDAHVNTINDESQSNNKLTGEHQLFGSSHNNETTVELIQTPREDPMTMFDHLLTDSIRASHHQEEIIRENNGDPEINPNIQMHDDNLREDVSRLPAIFREDTNNIGLEQIRSVVRERSQIKTETVSESGSNTDSTIISGNDATSQPVSDKLSDPSIAEDVEWSDKELHDLTIINDLIGQIRKIYTTLQKLKSSPNAFTKYLETMDDKLSKHPTHIPTTFLPELAATEHFAEQTANTLETAQLKPDIAGESHSKRPEHTGSLVNYSLSDPIGRRDHLELSYLPFPRDRQDFSNIVSPNINASVDDSTTSISNSNQANSGNDENEPNASLRVDTTINDRGAEESRSRRVQHRRQKEKWQWKGLEVVDASAVYFPPVSQTPPAEIHEIGSEAIQDSHRTTGKKQLLSTSSASIRHTLTSPITSKIHSKERSEKSLRPSPLLSHRLTLPARNDQPSLTLRLQSSNVMKQPEITPQT